MSCHKNTILLNKHLARDSLSGISRQICTLAQTTWKSNKTTTTRLKQRAARKTSGKTKIKARRSTFWTRSPNKVSTLDSYHNRINWETDNGNDGHLLKNRQQHKGDCRRRIIIRKDRRTCPIIYWFELARVNRRNKEFVVDLFGKCLSQSLKTVEDCVNSFKNRNIPLSHSERRGPKELIKPRLHICRWCFVWTDSLFTFTVQVQHNTRLNPQLKTKIAFNYESEVESDEGRKSFIFISSK